MPCGKGQVDAVGVLQRQPVDFEGGEQAGHSSGNDGGRLGVGDELRRRIGGGGIDPVPDPVDEAPSPETGEADGGDARAKRVADRKNPLLEEEVFEVFRFRHAVPAICRLQ